MTDRRAGPRPTDGPAHRNTCRRPRPPLIRSPRLDWLRAKSRVGREPAERDRIEGPPTPPAGSSSKRARATSCAASLRFVALRRRPTTGAGRPLTLRPTVECTRSPTRLAPKSGDRDLRRCSFGCARAEASANGRACRYTKGERHLAMRTSPIKLKLMQARNSASHRACHQSVS